MNVEISVTEAVDFFKQIQKKEKIWKMIRFSVQEEVGKYLTQLMDVELTHFLGKGRYERKGEGTNHRNGSYRRDFTLKRIGEVQVKVPRDRAGKYQTPRSFPAVSSIFPRMRILGSHPPKPPKEYKNFLGAFTLDRSEKSIS